MNALLNFGWRQSGPTNIIAKNAWKIGSTMQPLWLTLFEADGFWIFNWYNWERPNGGRILERDVAKRF